MNGDMPHVPITTLAGIAGLTDLLNQLPLPSPLPGTTTKSVLFSGWVVEEVSRLLSCRDEGLALQLASALNQVSTEHIELKDSLSTDDLEGDVPVLMQLLLSRNPNIFTATTTAMAPQYKITHNSTQGSPVSTNYQQGSVSHSPSGHFVAGPAGSGGRFVPPQTSPVPSPYTPQSPVTAYRQYSHPPTYSQPQHLQPGVFFGPGREPGPGLLLGSVEKPRGLGPSPGEKAGVYDALGSPSGEVGKVAGRDGQARPADMDLGGVFPSSDPEGELVEALAAIERMESEAALETDRSAKEVQDKDKPLKKRKQDSHPQEPGAGCGGGVVGGLRLAPASAVGGAEDVSVAHHWPQEPQEGVTPKPLQHHHCHDDRHPEAPRQKHRPEGRHADGEGSPRHAAQSASKPSALPTYVLGEHVGPGALPPYKEPEGAGHVGMGDGAVPQDWKQPRVCLERLEAESDMKKSVKPVVVLQKLSADEVQRLTRERDSRCSGVNVVCAAGGLDPSVLKDLPPELLAEIESTMPLCERVKVNKRTRSSANERPHYAEDSSDDQDITADLMRKRHKKDRDHTWEYEERDRRSSGEHRRGVHDARRGSGGRWDDSEDDTPSLSDVGRNLKKREKQKKRKAYEPKLTAEEMMDSSTFKRFCNSIESILENLEEGDFTAQDDDEIPQELLLGKHQLSELCSESAKIKAMGITDRIPSEKLVKLLNIMERNILDGSSLSTLMNPGNEGEDEERLWRDLIMERVTKSADACLSALHIMTSPHMPKAVYIEDVIERLLQFTKFHLQNTLYPQYDPVYRLDPKGGSILSSKVKRARCCTAKQRVIVMLYNKVCDVLSNISELLDIQLLTDTTILQVSSMGITPFFVENVSELQLCAIRLVTAVFSRYEKHRQLILEEIFTSLARLPTSKRSLRNFRLNSSDAEGEPVYIQMVSALVLQLIQCVVHLPLDSDNTDDDHKKVDDDVFITNSYETARRTAQNFLSVFLKKCGSKQGEEDYRPLFENFVQDLLSTVNKPEWPASELLLSLLGRLLVHQFSNKQTEMALRVASLDYLGTVAARLRKDSVTSNMDQKAIDRILQQASGKDETQQLQKALLDFMDENAETDPALTFARRFYVAQWFRDCTADCEKAMRTQSHKEDELEGTHHAKELHATQDILHRAEARKAFLHSVIQSAPNQFTTLRMNCNTVDYQDSCLIVRYLASTRPFSQSFDIYLTQILRVLGESAIAVRTKAMKCLSEVVAVDPSILARSDMQRGVHGRLMDNSTSVREAAVELVGRFVLNRPQLIEQYYDMLIERILDTGISVRKRVIKILRDICLEHPGFSRVTEMCVKMIRRVNDEEGIKKLVNETFQKLWFTPTPSHDKETMNRKITNISDVVAACRDSGYDWFEQLLQNLLKSEEESSYKPTRKACMQLVDNLVEYILKYEAALTGTYHKSVNSTRLVACITTLYLFSKIRPQLMIRHAMTMQPYLTTKCSSQSDFMVICNVAKILELVIPLMDHPSENFLTTVEEDLMKLTIKYGMTVVQHCVSCLGAVVNKVTHNYKFVWACFNRYYGALTKLKVQHQEGRTSLGGVTPNTNPATKAALLRSLFTVGALCRHFDFDLEHFKGPSKIAIKEKVLELLLYFTSHEDEEVQSKAIIALGFMFIMHPSQMFVLEVKTLYTGLLADLKSSVTLKIQVLKNLQIYLQEEDSRMQEADREWQKLSKAEDLKEMGDVSSGMSSSIMQLYLKQVLEAFFHTQSSVRHFALNVIALTLSQGLIHPVQCVPYLIAMGTDPEPSMRNKADQQLVDIDKKYTGFIHMKAVAGMKMAFQVQQAVMGASCAVIRGFRKDESHTALCSHLYSMVRTNRTQRRALLISLLNLFDDTSVKEDDVGVRKAKETEVYAVSGAGPGAESDSDSELEDVDAVMERLPDDSTPLLDFARASQGILLLLVLKQHLKNLYGFSDSKIQKYSPSESAKVYDKAVNRKSSIHFNPRQTVDFLSNNMLSELTDDLKRKIVRQFLDFKLLMEHLDPDEEEEEGETGIAVRNKAISALLDGAGGASPHDHRPAASDEDNSVSTWEEGGGVCGHCSG
uniref:Nipped-B protein n=1 Tax=Electrophorus electricus TaxID=8005 RepID=A0A4W4GC33_ELEEL